MWSWSDIIIRGNRSRKQLVEYVIFVEPYVPEQFIIRVFDYSSAIVGASDM